jgi:hypothetical protein
MPIGKFAMPLLAVFVCATAVDASYKAVAADAPRRALVIQAGFACSFSHGRIVCGETKSKKKKNGKDDGGERACPPGYVVLAKPNKCGSFCQPLSGDPCAPKGQAPGPSASQNICCDANLNGPGSGPIICSKDDPGAPETEAQIRQKFAKLFPQAKPTCKPQK